MSAPTGFMCLRARFAPVLICIHMHIRDKYRLTRTSAYATPICGVGVI